MADIRCSNCQTMNPAGATVCKNCGHPLADESTNWLDSLRSGTQSSSPEEPETNARPGDEAQPEEVPDWLQRIRQRNQENQAGTEESGPANEPSEELPDWLKEIQQSSSQKPSEPEASTEADWLQGLRGSEPAAEENTPVSGDALFTELPSEEAQGETPDWLKNLETWKESGKQEAPQPEESQPAESFNPFGMDQTPAQTPSPFAESDQDWLDRLSEQSGSQKPDAEAQPESSDSNLDWLSGLQAASEAPAEPAANPFTGFESSTGEAFSWENELPASEAAPAEPSKTPDWLRQLPADQPDAGQTAENEGQFGTFSSGEAESGQPTGDLPAWLSNFSSQQSDQPPAETQPAPESSDETPASQAEGIPDWLKQVPSQERPAQPAEPVTPISEEPQAANFSWESLGISTEPVADKSEQPADVSPFAGANLPEWLDQSGASKPGLPSDDELIPPAKPAGEAETPAPFGGNEIPDWLGESEKIAVPAQDAGETPGEGASDQPLEAADMPSWLQAMRPIETVAPKPVLAEDKQVEKAGPLAGLSGVLPTEDLVGQYIKPPLYSIKLRVSEKQRVHASLIESLIGEETQPQPIPAERGQAPKRVLRFLVAVVLILAILLPMLNFLPAFPSSDILPQELVSFGQIMGDTTAIPDGSAVLLALEYEPGLSGEMQTASEVVIRQLAERHVRLTIISTSPTGPILAESLLEKADYDPTAVVNLGYLAGGSTGLQSFGLSPVRSAPSTLQGQLAPWDSGVLAGVTRLSDFAATIVLTDDPDKGRTWVEQIQPALNGKPMLMVSSAQASPLLLPYYNSGQVKGVISGISGAASYESLVQSSGTATLLYGSYQYGMLLAAILILVGGLITGIISSITRGKAEKEA